MSRVGEVPRDRVADIPPCSRKKEKKESDRDKGKALFAIVRDIVEHSAVRQTDQDMLVRGLLGVSHKFSCFLPIRKYNN